MLAVNFLLLAAVLFCIGVFGVIARRNAVMVLMSIELILNSVNLNLIAFALMNDDVDGQVFALFVIADRRRRGRRRPRDGADDLPQPSFDLARRTVGDEGLTGAGSRSKHEVQGRRAAGWFLENAVARSRSIPAIGFAVIIFFGKRCRKGAEIGIASMAASLVARVRHRVAVDRTGRLGRASHGGEALGLSRRSAGRSRRAARGWRSAPFIEPVVRTWGGGRTAASSSASVTASTGWR